MKIANHFTVCRTVVLLVLNSPFAAASAQDNYTVLLTGASFADPAYGWFEYGSESVGAVPVNRAVSAESIVDTATTMNEGTLYANDEFDGWRLCYMHVHDREVFHDENRPFHE